MNNINKKIILFLKKFSNTEQLYTTYPNLKNHFNYEIDRFPTIEDKYLVRHLAKIAAQREFFLPLKCNFEVTSVCQLDCDFCYIGEGGLKPHRAKSWMTYDEFSTIWQDMELFTTEVEFTGGEPIINKDVYKMIQKANETGTYTTLTTNAQLMDEEIALKILEANPSRMLIAVDGIEEYMYESTRKKGNFKQLLKNISYLTQRKKDFPNNTTNIQLQIIIHKKTKDCIKDFEKLALELGADSISTKPIFIWPDSDEEHIKFMSENYLLQNNEKESYYTLGDDGKFIIEWREPGFCPNTQNVHIGSGGEVVPCWYLLRGVFETLRATEESFYNIWFSDRYKQYRQDMQYGEVSPVCKKCIGRYEDGLFNHKILNKD